MALLLNVEGKENIFSLVKEKFSEAEPMDKVLDWVFDLSQTKVLGTNMPNALGVENFDDFDLFILENLLNNKSEDEISAAIQNDYPSDNSAKLQKNLGSRAEVIKEAVLLKPLLA